MYHKRTCSVIARQLNWELVDQFMNLQNTYNFETEYKWDVASSLFAYKHIVFAYKHKFICIYSQFICI